MGKMLGTKLIDLRRNAGLTQEEAANKLEELCRLKEYPDNYMITRSSLANYEKGIRTPNLPKMILLSDFYSTEVMDLILISDDDLTKGFPLDFSAKLHKIQQEIMNSDNTTVEKDNEQNKNFYNKCEDNTTIRIPLISKNIEQIESIMPSDFVLSYSSRREFIMLDKFRQLTPESRAKIEERIDMLLEMQQEKTDNKK